MPPRKTQADHGDPLEALTARRTVEVASLADLRTWVRTVQGARVPRREKERHISVLATSGLLNAEVCERFAGSPEALRNAIREGVFGHVGVLS